MSKEGDILVVPEPLHQSSQPRLKRLPLSSGIGHGFSRQLPTPQTQLRSNSPKLFDKPPIPADSIALVRENPAPTAPVPSPWSDPRLAVLAIVFIFLIAYLPLAKALRRGPSRARNTDE